MAWNQSTDEKKADKPSTAKCSPMVIRGLVAAAIVVAGSVIGWLCLRSDPRETPPPARPSAPPAPIKAVNVSTAKTENVEITVHGEKKTVKVDEKDGFKYMKYPSGRVVRTKNPYLLKAMEEVAERWKDAPKPPPRDLSGRRYKSPALCQLAQYAVPGATSSPPGPMTDKEAVGILEEKIEIKPDDTDQEIEEKEYLVELQEEFREYMKNGGRAEAFFNKAYERQQMEAEAINTARREIKALVQQGNEEGARTALETYNKYLESKGIRPIKATKNLFRKKPTLR